MTLGARSVGRFYYPASVTWSATNLSPLAVLSGGALTATAGVGSTSAETSTGRCDTAISASKICAEFTINLQDLDGYVGFIIANATEDFTTGPIIDGNEVVILHNGSWTSYNTYFGPFGANFGFTTGSIVQLALDAVNGNYWVNVNNTGWNGDVIANQNPATNTGGYGLNSGTGGSLCTLGTGPYYLGFSVAYDGTNYSSITANFGATPYSYTPPAGFGNL